MNGVPCAKCVERNRKSHDSPQTGTLRKPLREKEQQAQTEHNGKDGPANNQSSKVVFDTPSRVVVLDAASISYVEVFGHTLVIHVLGGRTEQLTLSLTQAREILPKENFIQCHRSYVVNKDMVSSLRRYEVTLRNGETVPVSKQRYREVETALLAS